MNKYRVILKSGASFEVRAEDFRVTWDSNESNPHISGYQAVEASKWFMVIPSDISAVVKL